MFAKFRFLMATLLKMGLGDELLNQMKFAFNNSSKRFYHLMLDYLMSTVLNKNQNAKINNKKEIFSFLD